MIDISNTYTLFSYAHSLLYDHQFLVTKRLYLSLFVLQLPKPHKAVTPPLRTYNQKIYIKRFIWNKVEHKEGRKHIYSEGKYRG